MAKFHPFTLAPTIFAQREMRTRLHANVACIQLRFATISCQQRNCKLQREFFLHVVHTSTCNHSRTGAKVFQAILFYILSWIQNLPFVSAVEFHNFKLLCLSVFPHSRTNLDFLLLPNDIREYFMYFSGGQKKRKSIEFCLPYNEVFTFSPVLFCNRRNVSEILDLSLPLVLYNTKIHTTTFSFALKSIFE
jgi:hypothetical protein